ncbi:glycogen synthase GlgA [Flavisphingomonas formosensis]|uniref:glycogen synthase GlgA n=1 Tax=Flavisphingomonas formosensis TaxID=861534 RepID=UPI0012FCBCDA|nr:glycogen synthase GlgA [Sphingomonas formosensis]
MDVLAVASEMYPLVKTGGLADVVGALPAALAEHGVHVTTLLPGYPAVMRAVERPRALARYPDLFGGPARVVRAMIDGQRLLVLDAPHHFARDGGAYADAGGRDWQDNWRRFAALSAVAADLAGGAIKGFAPALVHAHDWQAAMTLAYMRHGAAHAVPAVLTIHNLAFQGRFDSGIFPALGLPASAFAVDGVEYYGGVGYLKAGLQYADAITTVSPAYAEEILTPAQGMGLDGLLSARRARLHGILNGIDMREWDPSGDALIPARYGMRSLAARKRNRRAVEKRFALASDESPIFCVVSRLTWQKGMDILADVVDDLVAMGGRLALIGTGDQGIEGTLLAAAARHQGRVGVMIGYDESVSHLLQAGADAIVIPSRFEPCGLTQLYGLRYGCVPVVARTGGLGDTVIDANEAALSAEVATGLVFEAGRGDSLRAALRRAVTLHREPGRWAAIQRAGMKADFSWGRSAERYAALYRSLTEGPAPE